MSNETITGKIYPVWNADKTERRFPQTVIEAVLGLPTYLQDQFSALADIYMPIEGITESKTGQEFVYRKSPATIKAKSLTLDRIYGKTLAWNQAIVNPTLANTHDGWILDGSGWAIVAENDSEITLGGLTGAIGFHSNTSSISGHKYLCSFRIRINNAGGSDTPTFGSVFYCGGSIQPSLTLGQYSTVKSIRTANTNYHIGFSFYPATNITATIDKTFGVNTIDLTLLYGSEIDGLTDEQILAKFESEFPGYHDFGNKLISNDASAIETVGFNKWDEEWEVGSINGTSGQSQTSTNTIRTKNYIPVFSGQEYYLKCSVSTNPYFYDSNKNYLGRYGSYIANTEFTVPTNAAYMRLSLSSDYGTTYNHDICINLSDPAKNGTYEPYRKTTLQLGLNNFKVKDGNGNITTITGGLKSAGSVRDEIVGNKYIKRVKRVDLGELEWSFFSTYGIWRTALLSDSAVYPSPAVCSKYSYQQNAYNGQTDKVVGHYYNSSRIVICDSSFNNYSEAQVQTALSGVYLDYELATPIEYELVEPLVYSMAAGTTEERISPNSDGLSAPFCCDMTYDANANNDSANAQYALTAGRLYNSHKLWGQDFDGSNDVSGALSGVTTIGASGNITTAAQLISTVATGTAPLSVASTTEVANLHSYTATKLHTQRTLWGQNFDGSGNVTGDMSNVGNIAFSASGKNIASLLYFDTTYSRVGVGASSPAYKLDVNGTLNASGNTTLGGTLDVTGNTTIGGTFTVGTSSVNKATTLYGALTASGAVSFSDTLTIAGLTTFNGNAILPANKTFTIGPASGTHATLEWDATNGCVKITGNLRVTGWIEQQGTQS